MALSILQPPPVAPDQPQGTKETSSSQGPAQKGRAIVVISNSYDRGSRLLKWGGILPPTLTPLPRVVRFRRGKKNIKQDAPVTFELQVNKE